MMKCLEKIAKGLTILILGILRTLLILSLVFIFIAENKATLRAARVRDSTVLVTIKVGRGILNSMFYKL